MYLDKLVKWVKTYGTILTPSDKSDARRMLVDHLDSECKCILTITERLKAGSKIDSGDIEYITLTQESIIEITQSLNILGE